MKNLYLFTDSFPYGSGETFLENEITYLCNKFNAIYIIPIFSNYSQKLRNTPENSTVLKPPFKCLKNKKELMLKGIFNTSPIFSFINEFFSKKVYSNPKKIWNWGTHFLITRNLIRYLKKNNLLNLFNDKNNICYFYWGVRWSYILPFIDEINSKIVVRFHGSDLYEELNHNYIPFRKEQIIKINYAIFISKYGLDYFEKKYPFFSGKKHLGRLGTEDYGLNPYNKGSYITIVSCSNLVRIKRVDLIAKSLSLFNEKVKWIHFGDGPEMKRIKKLVKTLPPNIKVQLMGRVANKDLMNFYSKNPVDLFINTSYSEGVPVSIMEALSFGIPVVATNVGGTPEIVDNEVGWLLDKDTSPETIAEIIKKLINNENYYQLRINARQRWEKLCCASRNYNDFVNFLMSL